MNSERSPGQRAGLTRGAVVAAARELVMAGGADTLSMRALARKLQVAPNALYSHVESRTQLLDALLDDLLGSLDAPDDDVADPLAGVAELMTATYRLLTAHPHLVPLFLARQGARGPNAVRLGRVMDALLGRAGLPEPSIPDARRVLIIHTIGCAAFAIGPPVAPDSERPMSADDAFASFAKSLGWLLAGITQGAAPLVS